MKKNMSGCHTKLFLLDILLFSNQTKERETIFSIFVVSVLFEADLDRTLLLLLLLLVKPLIQDKYLNWKLARTIAVDCCNDNSGNGDIFEDEENKDDIHNDINGDENINDDDNDINYNSNNTVHKISGNTKRDNNDDDNNDKKEEDTNQDNNNKDLDQCILSHWVNKDAAWVKVQHQPCSNIKFKL